MKGSVSQVMPNDGEARAVSRVGYVLSLFPCYDETFILREMKALKEQGVKRET